MLLATPAAAAPEPTCADAQRLRVPGAERHVVSCLADLTTAGTTLTGHTDPTDWAGMHAPGTVNPAGVPGFQIDGYFPDSSTTNTTRGWNHDSQFVIRLPQRWNGGLVIAGPPGNRKQYSSDFIISDWVLARGYAYASTDKGNTGTNFHRDGVRTTRTGTLRSASTGRSSIRVTTGHWRPGHRSASQGRPPATRTTTISPGRRRCATRCGAWGSPAGSTSR